MPLPVDRFDLSVLTVEYVRRRKGIRSVRVGIVVMPYVRELRNVVDGTKGSRGG